MNSVRPSGAALVSSRNTGSKAPPVLFSTKTFVCRLALSFCAISRAVTSVAPPAATPTRMRIGFPEMSWASAGRTCAPASVRKTIEATKPVDRRVHRIASSPLQLYGRIRLFCRSFNRLANVMSALCHSRTFHDRLTMSTLPPWGTKVQHGVLVGQRYDAQWPWELDDVHAFESRKRDASRHRSGRVAVPLLFVGGAGNTQPAAT